MDYLASSWAFRLRKVMRYCQIYGPARTLAKVRAQRHMKRRFTSLPAQEKTGAGRPRSHIGIIGCGNFSYSNIAYYLRKNFGRCMRGAMDIDINRAASLFLDYHLDYYTDDAARIINDPMIDLIFIASNHASHAEYAIAALRAGKAVHIEKPHVVSRDQLHRLIEVACQTKGRVSLGFNRPMSPLGVDLRKALASQPGAAMFNWFVAGHEIPADHWYFAEAEGGRVLGNLCHWTDFLLHLIPVESRYPLRIIPVSAEKSDCDIVVSYVFSDGSIGSITFSAKGHTFEGVRERLSCHKGDLLLQMDDFKFLQMDVREHRSRRELFFRDHGHETAVVASYAMSGAGGGKSGADLRYIMETGDLFLATREALEGKKEITLSRPVGPILEMGS